MGQFSIAVSGGDFPNRATFEAFADTYWASNSDILIGETQDAAEYNENVVVSFATTPTATKHLQFTCAPGVRHAGVFTTGKARSRGSTNGAHVWQIDESFTQIEWEQITQSSTGDSDEGIRIGATNDVLISHCVIRYAGSANDCDGIYAGGYGIGSCYVDNCIIYDFTRAGINAQNWSGFASQVWFIDYCTILNTGAAGESETGIHGRISGSNSVTLNVFNTFVGDTTNGDDYAQTGAVTWAGSNNACTDASLTARGLTAGAVENLTTTDTSQSSGAFAVFTSLSGDNFLLLDDAAGNQLHGNGVNRIGSEPTARQDFSIDISGDSGITVRNDIGADYFTASGAPVSRNLDARYEIAGRIVRAPLTTVESHGHVIRAAVAQYEALTRLLALTAARTDSLTGITHNSIAPHESRASTVAGWLAALEQSAQVQHAAIGAHEALQNVNRAGDMRIESLNGIAHTSAAQHESVANAITTWLVALEHTAQAQRAMLGAHEALQRVNRSGDARIECQGAAAVIRQALIVIESRGTLSRNSAHAYEANTIMTKQLNAQVEALRIINANINVVIEQFALITLSADGLIEAAARVILPAGLAVESVRYIQSALIFNHEALRAVADATGVPIETLQGATVNAVIDVITRTAYFTVLIDRELTFTAVMDRTITVH